MFTIPFQTENRFDPDQFLNNDLVSLESERDFRYEGMEGIIVEAKKRVGDIGITSNTGKTSKKKEFILLDKENLRQYLDFLQEAFPGLTRRSIAELINEEPYKMNGLLSKRAKSISCDVAAKLFQLYWDLKNGKKTYTPSKRKVRRHIKHKRYTQTIPLDKKNLRQYVNYLQESFPGLTIKNISLLAGFKKERLNTLLNNFGPDVIFPEEVTALFQLFDELKSGQKTYTPSSAKWTIGKREMKWGDVPLDHDNLDQYIDFLRQAFPGIKLKDISEAAGINCKRLKVLRYPQYSSRIQLGEIDQLFKAYEVLKSKPALCVYHDPSALCQYIGFLQHAFPGLTQIAISDMAGIDKHRLHQLLKSKKPKLMRADEIDRLFEVYHDLAMGKKSCQPPSRMTVYRTVDRAPLDKANLKQYIAFLRDTFPGLGQATISKLAGFGDQHVDQLLYSHRCKRISPLEVQALFQVYWDLKSGKKSYVPRKKRKRDRPNNSERNEMISLDHENLRQYVGFLQKRYPDLTLVYISELAGLSGSYLRNVFNNKPKTIRRFTAEALMSVYEKLESNKELINTSY